MTEAKLFAAALLELRIILSAVVGPDADHELKVAERMAYALHNDALALIDGKPIDQEAALARIAHIDQVIGGNDGQRIANSIRSAISN
jgi:hypothetical protein